MSNIESNINQFRTNNNREKCILYPALLTQPRSYCEGATSCASMSGNLDENRIHSRARVATRRPQGCLYRWMAYDLECVWCLDAQHIHIFLLYSLRLLHGYTSPYMLDELGDYHYIIYIAIIWASIVFLIG